MTALLLTLNAGSSSIKLGLFGLGGDAPWPLGRGRIDLQQVPLRLVLEHDGRQAERVLQAPVTDSLHEVADAMLAALQAEGALAGLHAAAHRVVHGGPQRHGPVRLDDATLAALDALTPLAPLHQPHSLRLVRALRQLRPALVQTASFDTAFHQTQDPLARRFALPRALHDEGVQRYGFHGLSYAFIAGELARVAPQVAAGRVVVAHLGSGASLCGMREGRSIDTSMGFSALDGVPMATRCGALDPGAVLYLMQRHGLAHDALEDLLYHRSGLLGVSGLSADARTLRRSEAPQAREALDLFALRCAGEAARIATTLGGLDALVFTAGIGEHDAALRAAVCERLGWLGVQLDDDANARHARRIERGGSRVAVFVIPTDEERTIAHEAWTLLC